MQGLAKAIFSLAVLLITSAPAFAQDEMSPWQDYNPAPVLAPVDPPMPLPPLQAPRRNRCNYAGLPETATSSVDLSICDLPPKDPPSVYSQGGGNPGGNPGANLPPPPGPGYQPIYQHGVFVGYMSPELIDLMQTDPAAAWTQFANSPDFTGPEGLRLSLLAETGAATPEQMAQLQQMALFGM